MYPASADFITAIKSSVRHIHWNGSIDLDTPITFDDEHNIVSCNISKQISGQKLDIGTVYIGQITTELILPSVSRYELYGKTIETSVTVDGASDVIPMGIFTIMKATQTADHISITGYDNMTKFEDVNVSAKDLTVVQSPFAWLTQACTACGVVLGSTSAEIGALPNGNRKTGFADVVNDVKTWRDVLSYLGAYLGSYSYIGRDGKLYLGQYRGVEDDTVPANFRGSSNLSDYRTTYNGIYNISKSDALQEYVDNENEDGLVLDLGTNPFLQFTNQDNRLSALQEIIDLWNGVYYVPFNATMPLIPTYDAGDVLKFVDNQADQYDIGVITEITYNIDGSMTVKCSGDNPRLMSAQDRFSKTVAGLSAEYNNGQQIGGKDFWLLHSENTDSISVGSTKTQVTEIEWNQTVDVQRMGFMFACDGDLSATATIVLEISVDDDVDYTFEVTENKSMVGKRTYGSNCGFDIQGKGLHTAKVYMTVTDNPTLWSDLV